MPRKEKPKGFYIKLTLGKVYHVRTTWCPWYTNRWRHCKFIKVTRKGFNLLDINTSKTIMNKACYARGFAGKEIPSEKKTFTVWFPEWVEIGAEVEMDNAG